MNHYPFEDWLYSEQLGKEERTQLNAHLRECGNCRAVAEASKETLRMLSTPMTASPAPGFTLRWVNYANARSAAEQSKQVRLIFAIFFGFALLSAAAIMALYFLAGISLTEIFTSIAYNTLRVIQRTIITIQSYRFVLSVLPIRLPDVLWAIIAANAGFWIAFWGLSIWKFPAIKRVFA